MSETIAVRTGQGSPGASPTRARRGGAIGVLLRRTSSPTTCRDGGRSAFTRPQRTNACASPLGWTVAIAGLGLVAFCPAAIAQVAPPAPSVSVVPVASRQVTESDDYIGRVTAIDKVDIVARVPGYIEQRNFTEGQPVKTGDLLFRIEQDTYKAAVEQQRATLAKAKATEVNAALQLARSKELVRNQNISQAAVDQRAADDASAQADIMAAQAALDQAEINLGYTEIRSPINGRIGIANFTIGNLVGPSSGSLATIVSQDPIYVIFQASEGDVLDYKRRFEEAGGAKNGPIAVHIKLTDGSVYPELGVPNFLDIQVDNTTDTVAVRAQVPNPQGLLVPGGYVTVSIDRGAPRAALVVPQSALLADQGGRYVLVVDEAKKVEVRRVTTGSEQGSDVIVTQGLKEGDLVIVDGTQKVRPGQVVAASVVQGK
ncbi:MAG TPA: efflux RND transporter periplasmic adaptor subunit [Stellaceae bacterium]|nr:efflux RND transporter periplasmic adaptor subunit [Stellaceae bacterium]